MSKYQYPKPIFREGGFLGTNKWICRKCKKEYTSEGSAIKCTKSHLFKCEICGSNFTKEDELKQHHLKNHDHCCKVCEERFTSRTKLFKHLEDSCVGISKEEQVTKEAQEYEKYLDYQKAIELYDKIDKPEEAARVRKIVAEQKKVDQTVVHGDYVDDRDTIIKDSVVNKSNVGAGGKSKSEELREAKALLDDGIIDDDEFKQMKKEILGK